MRRILFIAVFSLFLLPVLQAQNVDQTFDAARQAQSLNRFEEAVRSYNRLIFFLEKEKKGTPGRDSLLYLCRTGIAECYTRQNKHLKAAEAYQSGIYLAPGKQAADEMRIKELRSYLLIGDLKTSREILVQFDTTANPELGRRVMYYNGIYQFFGRRYDSSRAIFMKLAAGQPDKQRKVDSLFKRNRKIDRRYNPKVALYMSAVIPGSGQMYLGEWKKGLNSFLLTSGFLALGYSTYASYGILDALVAIFPWYLRYYQGGLTIAVNLAWDKQDRERAKVYRALLGAFESQETSPSGASDK